MSFIPLLLKYWRYVAGAALLAAFALAIHHYGAVRYKAGKAHTQALWDANRADIQKVADKALAAAKAKEDIAAANNAEVLRNANTELVAIAADRDSLIGRLRDARHATAGRCSLPEAGSVAGVVAAPENSGDGSLDAAIVDALTEAKSNNVTHAALIAVVNPQF